ncbi:MAG: hypothetical protein NXI24_04990 [bacterium]|nr:hypothetical protein [bacterium]
MRDYQYPEVFESFSMKAAPSGVLLGVVLGILIALIAAGWRTLAAAPGDRDGDARPLRESADGAVDPLWAKAVAIAGRNDRWVARRFSEERRVYNAAGELKETTQSTFAVSGAEKSDLAVRVLTSLKDGADYRAAKAAELAKSREREKRRSGGDGKKEAENPFAPENQARVQARPLGAERTITIAGRSFRAFAFTQKTATGPWDGVAYLDAQTGAPGRLISTARVATLPPSDDAAFELRGLRVRINFAFAELDRWQARTVRLDLKIRYRVAPLLTFEGRVRNTYRFSQFERLGG